MLRSLKVQRVRQAYNRLRCKSAFVRYYRSVRVRPRGELKKRKGVSFHDRVRRDMLDIGHMAYDGRAKEAIKVYAAKRVSNVPQTQLYTYRITMLNVMDEFKKHRWAYLRRTVPRAMGWTTTILFVGSIIAHGGPSEDALWTATLASVLFNPFIAMHCDLTYRNLPENGDVAEAGKDVLQKSLDLKQAWHDTRDRP